LENDTLYDSKHKTIYYHRIASKVENIAISEGVSLISKHAFYACNNIKKIILPFSLVHMENNPFSNCEKLTLQCNTKWYHVDNGIIYNKFKNILVGCLKSSKCATLIIPSSVKTISRNAF
jgi:hypothetical protein